jgi:hypothetical protein
VSNEAKPTGELYSRVYIERGKPTRDSERFRARLAAFFGEAMEIVEGEVAKMISIEIGTKVPIALGIEPRYQFSKFFGQADLLDVLNSITLIWKVVAHRRIANLAERWLAFVRRVMREENVGYSIDDRGGVHPFIDQEFERNRAATVAALGTSRYAAALKEFEAAHAALEELPPDGKTAIRAVFESAEAILKLMFKVQRLNTKAVNDQLKPAVQRLYAGNKPALEASNHLLGALGDWVDAAHNYRHAAGTEEPQPPPLDLAIALVSTGASWVRWLADIDSQMMGSGVT